MSAPADSPQPPRHSLELMKRKKLTARQKAIYCFYVTYLGRWGYPPTFRELAEEFDVARPVAFRYTETLAKKGYLIEVGPQRKLYPKKGKYNNANT